MVNHSNTSIHSLVFLATLSTSVLTMNYEDLPPEIHYAEPNFSYPTNQIDWKDNAFNESSEYYIQSENTDKLREIINFSHKILDNTTDLDSEFVDIVNKNFWDLI